MYKYHLLCVIGTRPEALKMLPLIKALKLNKNISVTTLVTAQHRELLDQMLNDFSIKIDHDFNIMKTNQTLGQLSAKLLKKFEKYLSDKKFDLMIAQGDTTTTMITALSAFYHHIPFAHIEAGLRTHDIHNPFPEELNRKFISHCADLNFCPTKISRENLLKEGISKNVFVTGNTIIDTLILYAKKNKSLKKATSKLILVTCHRRENFGIPLKNICLALKKIITQHPDIEIIFPVHPNPNIKKTVYDELDNVPAIKLIPPMNYKDMVGILSQSLFVLTDSGGLQEEAPALGKPVLVLRNETERPESIFCGAAKLVGHDIDMITHFTNQLLSNKEIYEKMSTAGSPYGNGEASLKISKIILSYLDSKK